MLCMHVCMYVILVYDVYIFYIFTDFLYSFTDIYAPFRLIYSLLEPRVLYITLFFLKCSCYKPFYIMIYYHRFYNLLLYLISYIHY